MTFPQYAAQCGDDLEIIKKRAYAAERIGVKEDTVKTWKLAAEVAVLAGQHFVDLKDHMKHLVAIHAAPQETWKAWVALLFRFQSCEWSNLTFCVWCDNRGCQISRDFSRLNCGAAWIATR